MALNPTQQFNKNYRNYSKQLIQFLMANQSLYRINDEEVANGIVSEVFLTLIDQHNKSGKPGTIFDVYNFAYFKTTCHHKALSRLRDDYEILRESLFVTGSDNDDSVAIKAEVEAAATLFNDDDYVTKENRLLFIEDCLNHLPDKQRSLIIGSVFEHKSLTELALQLGYKDATVAKATKYRLMQDLKQLARQAA